MYSRSKRVSNGIIFVTYYSYLFVKFMVKVELRFRGVFFMWTLAEWALLTPCIQLDFTTQTHQLLLFCSFCKSMNTILADNISINFLVHGCSIVESLNYSLLGLLKSVVQTSGVDVKKNVIIAITSDKGLCGGINSTSVKVSKALHKMTSGNLVHVYLLSFMWPVLKTMAHNSSNQVQTKKASMSY